jgi:putative transposase
VSKIPSICSDTKRLAIKTSLAATRERRNQKDTAVIKLKINTSKCSLKTLNHLKMVFVEAKWLYNWYLSDTQRMIDRKPSVVLSLDKDQNAVARELKYISSQMKQAVHQKLIDNMKGLKASKEKGRFIGRLKFRSELNVIDLVQPGITFRLSDNKLSIQGLKEKLRLFGADQLPKNADICSAQLIQKSSGYYLHVVISRLKSKGFGTTGIDFGIKNQLTLSNGVQINYSIPVSKRTKRLQLKLSRAKRGSKNRLKAKGLLTKSHEKDTNKRNECINKIVGYLKTFDRVVYQNDSIKGWQSGRYGKAIQKTAIGAIKSRIKQMESAIEVNRFTPTTKPCHRCGTLHDILLSQRTFYCSDCGGAIDRDLNSALVIERLGLESKQIPTEHRKSTPVEILTSALKIMDSSYLNVSRVAEAGSLSL